MASCLNIQKNTETTSIDLVSLFEERKETMPIKRDYSTPDGRIKLKNKDSLDVYDEWKSPIVIISDGPYGVDSFLGDLPTYEELDKFYEPHIRKWSEKSTPQTTLWFWNTEVGWATVHPIFLKYGWTYVNKYKYDKCR